MNNEFFDALRLLEKEKNINLNNLTEKIKNAISLAIRKNYGNISNIIINLDIEKNIFSTSIIKNVVEQVTDNLNEISLSEALKYDINAKVGYPVMIDLDTKKFGRIAALSAKHIIKQGIRDAEKDKIYETLKQKEHMVISAIVSKVDPQRSNVSLMIDSSEIILPKLEQIPNEHLVEGEVIKIYVSEVTKTEKGPKILISRSHPELVKHLFMMEIPEIKTGIIEIKSVAREAGARTKIAVYSNNENIDPVGSCVGAKGIRVNKIVNELKGEKIDIIQYSDDFVEYISNALAPANISCVVADPTVDKSCYVFVSNDQLSLAIGNRGQNVRLSAKLTGWKIDIKTDDMLNDIRNEIEQKQQNLENTENLEDNTEEINNDDDNQMIFNFDEEINKLDKDKDADDIELTAEKDTDNIELKD